MKILKTEPIYVSNSDMLNWVREDQEYYARRGVRPPRNAEHLWNKTVEYLTYVPQLAPNEEGITYPHPAPDRIPPSQEQIANFSAELLNLGFGPRGTQPPNSAVAAPGPTTTTAGASAAEEEEEGEDDPNPDPHLTPAELVSIVNLKPADYYFLIPIIESWDTRFAPEELNLLADAVNRCLVGREPPSHDWHLSVRARREQREKVLRERAERVQSRRRVAARGALPPAPTPVQAEAVGQNGGGDTVMQNASEEDEGPVSRARMPRGARSNAVEDQAQAGAEMGEGIRGRGRGSGRPRGRPRGRGRGRGT